MVILSIRLSIQCPDAAAALDTCSGATISVFLVWRDDYSLYFPGMMFSTGTDWCRNSNDSPDFSVTSVADNMLKGECSIMHFEQARAKKGKNKRPPK